MKIKKIFFFYLVVSILDILSISAFAEIKFKWGSHLRLRHEYWKNIFDFDNDNLDNRNFFRIKTSLWGQLDYNKNLSLFAKLTDEFKPYIYYAPSSSKMSGKTDKAFHFDINEIIFDNFYLDLNNFIGLPLDLRLGRQDFLGNYGEGFLIMDGTPQDGSRTFYFNALRASWRMNEQKRLDFIYLINPRDDVFLPVLNEDKTPQQLNTTDEKAFILYLKDNTIKDLIWEYYYIYKREGKDGGRGFQAEKGKINTLGSFMKYNFGSSNLRGQFAYQFGTYGTKDRQGFGGYIFLDRTFKDLKWEPTMSLGFIYLSGDDRDTGKNEAWDPLFSRWPWISELYVLSMASETGIVGYWTNLDIFRTELALKPSKKTKLSLWYNYLRANEQVTSSSVFSGTGKERGHLPQIKLDYLFNKNISAYILVEYFIPGNFYRENDEALFLRTELQFKF